MPAGTVCKPQIQQQVRPVHRSDQPGPVLVFGDESEDQPAAVQGWIGIGQRIVRLFTVGCRTRNVSPVEGSLDPSTGRPGAFCNKRGGNLTTHPRLFPTVEPGNNSTIQCAG